MVLLILYSLKAALGLHLRNIQHILNGKKLDENTMSEIVDNGFTLLELARQANDIYGKVLAIDFISVMIMDVVGIFTCLALNTAIGNSNPAHICLCIAGFFIVILNMIKLYSYTRIGQALSEVYFEIHERMDKLLLLDGISIKQRRELKFLVKRFSVRAPIRPLDMFDMNSANFAVISNIMMTYVIILMQFKGF